MPIVRRPHGCDGFTLVELLVGVLVLTLLAAIALPSFASQPGKADAAAVRQGLADAATALESCRVETADYTACRDDLPDRFDAGGYTAALQDHAYTLVGATRNGASFTIAHTAASTDRSCSPGPAGATSCRDGSW